MARKTPKDAEARLTDLDVREVSVVDRPANKRRFLIVKRDGGGLAVIRTEEKMPRAAIPREAAEEFGHILIQDAEDDGDERSSILKDEDIADLVGLGDEDEEEEEAEVEEIEKGAVGDTIKVAKGALARLSAVANKLKGGSKEKDAKVDPAIVSEVKKIAAGLRALAKKLGGGKGKGKDEESESDSDATEKAAAKDLLDACNAALSALMKATNALKKLNPDDDVPSNVADMIAAAAESLSGAGGGGDEEEQADDGKKKPPKPPKPPKGEEDAEDEEKSRGKTNKREFQVAAFLRKGAEEDEDPEVILKIGQKMKRTRLSLFKKAVETLVTLLEELEGRPPADKREAKPSKREKADEDFQQKMLEGMKGLRDEVGKVAKRVDDLETARPAGEDEDPPEPVQKSKKGMWSSVLGTVSNS